MHRSWRGEYDAAERGAFTMVECLTAIAIVGIIAAIALPAVMRSREAARRIGCASNLHQLGIAIHAYHDSYGRFPSQWAPSVGAFHVQLLPFIEQTPLYEFIQRVEWRRPIGQGHVPFVDMNIPLYVCPGETLVSDETTHGPGGLPNYLMNEGSGWQTFGRNGFDDSPGTRAADFVDGLSQTVALSERLTGSTAMNFTPTDDERRVYHYVDRPYWGPHELDAFADACRDRASRAPGLREPLFFYLGGGYGYNHILTPNQNSCFNSAYPETEEQRGARTANSNHAGGVHVLMADGACRFVGDSIDRAAWRAMGSRNGGEPIGVF